MFGKFIFGGLFKNVLEIDEFKKFRKTYSIINLVWLALAIVTIVLLVIFNVNITTALYALVGINIALFIISIVKGNKIYNKHKDELPKPVEVNSNLESNDSSEEVIETHYNNDDSHYSYENQIENNNNIHENYTHKDESLIKLRSYKQMFNEGLISEKEFESLKQGLLKKEGMVETVKTKRIVIGLHWFFNVLNVASILTNIIIALCINGCLDYMYYYIMYGYIVGFILIGISTVAIILIWLTCNLGKTAKARAAVWGGIISIIVTFSLMIMSIFL